MKLKHTPALILTLLVDFVCFGLGAALISFFGTGGTFVFLIEFLCIRAIHRRVYAFFTGGKHKGQDDIVEDDTNQTEQSSNDIPLTTLDGSVSVTQTGTHDNAGRNGSEQASFEKETHNREATSLSTQAQEGYNQIYTINQEKENEVGEEENGILEKYTTSGEGQLHVEGIVPEGLPFADVDAENNKTKTEVGIETSVSHKADESFVEICKPSKKSMRIITTILVGIMSIGLVVLFTAPKKKFPGYLYPICENGLYGYMDSVGNTIIEPQFLWASTYSDGRAVVVVDTVFKVENDTISTFRNISKYNVGDVINEKDIVDTVVQRHRLYAKYGFIDKAGEFTLAPMYMVRVPMLVSSMQSFNLASIEDFFYNLRFEDERAIYFDTLSWKVGFINYRGEVVVPPVYESGSRFSEGRAVVCKHMGHDNKKNHQTKFGESDLKFAYIDTQGNQITDFLFENLTLFRSGRGVGREVRYEDSDEDDGGRRFLRYNILIDEDGQFIDTLSFFDNYLGFSSDGICIAETAFFLDVNDEPLYSFIDKKGKELERLKGLSEARAAAISKQEDFVCMYPEEWSVVDATFFNYGLAGVSPNGNDWVFIDKYYIIHGNKEDPVFEKIGGFYNNLSAVKKNGKWGFVDNQIREVIPFKYDSCGLAYPYLEEAFDLNVNGSISKRYWINRLDSIVWESDLEEHTENLYSNKSTGEWGMWRTDLDFFNYMFVIRIICIVICVLLMVIVIILIMSRTNPSVSSQQWRMKKKHIAWFGTAVSSMLCLISVHFLSDYFLNYTDTDEDSMTISKNVCRIKARNDYDYDEQRFGFYSHLDKFTSMRTWSKYEFGTIPIGKYVSTYVGSSTDSYYAGMKEVTRYRTKAVPNYRTYDYGWGMEERYQDGWKYVEEPYVDHEPVYYGYDWQYAISAFDISDRLTLFANEDSVYSDYLRELATQLTVNYGYKYIYTTVDCKKALQYTTFDKVPLKRVIFCANGRAYIIETKSISDLGEHAQTVREQIRLNKCYYAESEGQRIVLLSIFGILLGATMIMLLYAFIYRPSMVRNRAARLFFLLSMLSAFLNATFMCYLVYNMYMHNSLNGEIFATSENVAHLLLYSLGSLILISMPMVCFYRKKEGEEDVYDFIIPKWIDKFVYSHIQNVTNKKLFLTFVGYPLMVGSLLPLGIVTLAYSIPALIISAILTWGNRWVEWIHGTNKPKLKEMKVNFVDYYSVLRVASNATVNDINAAYNSCMASYNQRQALGNMVRKEYAMLQEAYRVLSVETWKNLYDAEFSEIVRSANPSACVIQNKALKEYIKNIRQEYGERKLRIDNSLLIKIVGAVIIVFSGALLISQCSGDE